MRREEQNKKYVVVGLGNEVYKLSKLTNLQSVYHPCSSSVMNQNSSLTNCLKKN
jgi:hypothetical protein